MSPRLDTVVGGAAEVGVILVTGASGRVGGQVLRQLLDGGYPARGLSRDPGARDLPAGAEIARGDLSVADSLDAALEGVEAVFLLWHQPSAKNPRAAVARIAERVDRIVYVSSLAVRDDLAEQTHPMSTVHADLEDAVSTSGADWTVLRTSWFASNAFGWIDDIRGTGVVRRPYPDTRRSPIAQQDIGAVAVRALTQPGHAGRTYALTGPEVLTEEQLIATVAGALGRAVVCQRIDPEVARRGMLDAGIDPELADAALAYWRQLVDEPEPVTRTVEEITGRPATRFADWVATHIARDGNGSPSP